MDRLSSERRSENMRRIRAADTKPELAVRRLLHNAGFRFRIHRKSLPGTPDIVLPRYRAVIFVHGCFWHCHEGCRDAHQPKTNTAYWAPKLARNCERDAAHEAALKALGWITIVVWACEVRDPDALRERLRRSLGELLPGSGAR